MHVTDEPQWKQAYIEALFESEPELLPPKVQTAQCAIENRLLELGSQRDADRAEEILELTDAQRVLRWLCQDEQF